MTSINGNFGLFGNNGDKRVGQQKGLQKPAEVKTNVPVGKAESVEHKELGDKLLDSANFYAPMGISLGATKKPEAGSLEDLDKTVHSLDIKKADLNDRKQVASLNPTSLTSFYALKDVDTYGALEALTIDSFLNEEMPIAMLNDILAEVEIKKA